MRTEYAYILLLGGAVLTILGAIMLTATLYRFGHPNTEVSLMRLMFFILMLFIGVVAITFALATSAKAQNSEPRVMCTSGGGPIFIGKDWPVSVPLKCCPAGSFISGPEHHVDAKGNLICYREKT